MNTQAAQIIGTAFRDYKLMKYAFEGYTDEQRSVLVNRLYTNCVNAAAKYGGVLTEENLGALIWLPDNNFRLTLWQEIASGMAAIPFQIGIKPTLRLVQHDGESEGWIRKHADTGMGYLWCIGVLPHARGKGLSRKLIDDCIQQMRRAGLTTCWLKTEDPVNVSIYQKLGFVLKNEMVVKSSGITSWALVKQIV